MKQNSSIIFRRPVPVKPAWLYYVFEWLIRLSIVLVVSVAICYLIPSWRESLIMLIIAGVIAETIVTIVKSMDNIKIYTDGGVCYNYRWGNTPKRFTAQDIKQIEITTYKQLFGTFRKILMNLKNGKRVEVLIEDDLCFRNELLNHNPDINIIE